METKQECLWCGKRSGLSDTTFVKRAHTIPQSLGGKHICDDVCDDCNHTFGRPMYKRPAVEVVLREAFELTRHMVMARSSRSNQYARFKSIFFNLNKNNNTYSVKQSYAITPGFQQMLARQFKRGVFKIFLEEYNRQTGKGKESRYDFVREFARFDLGEVPIFYLVPKLPVLFYSEKEFVAPELNFTKPALEQIDSYDFYLLTIFGHGFYLPTHRNWALDWENTRGRAPAKLGDMYRTMVPINNFSDIDFECNFMDVKGSAWDV